MQAVSAVLEIGEFELAGHATHTLATVAPVTVEYLPETQSAHAALPVTFLYFPATHCVHTTPSAPVNPTLHVQAVRAVLEFGELEPVGHAVQVPATEVPVASEYVPTTQSVQTAVPFVVLYFPATHCVHGPPFDPEEPALQMQACTDVALSVETYE
jgi:hypothetical protein